MAEHLAFSNGETPAEHEDSALAALQKQIHAPDTLEKRTSLLSRAVGLIAEVFWNEDRKSLDRLNKLEAQVEQAKETGDVFAAAHCGFSGVNKLAAGAVEKNPFLSNIAIGAAFGTSFGAVGEIEQQLGSGKDVTNLYWTSIIRSALVSGGLNALAAAPGGIQSARYRIWDLSSQKQIGISQLSLPSPSENLQQAASVTQDSAGELPSHLPAEHATGRVSNDSKGDTTPDDARSRFINWLSSGDVEDAITMLNSKLLTKEDLPDGAVRDAAVTGLIRCFSKKPIRHALRILGLALISADELKTDAVRDATLTGLLRYLKEGASVFGAARMLRYSFTSPQHILSGFHDVIELYHRSGLNSKQFYDNILSQVHRDDSGDTGCSFDHFREIAGTFTDSVDTVLQQARNYPDVSTVHQLVASFPDRQSVFASWPRLQRFSKLQQCLSCELLPELQQLRLSN